jgi:hypothetical protein
MKTFVFFFTLSYGLEPNGSPTQCFPSRRVGLSVAYIRRNTSVQYHCREWVDLHFFSSRMPWQYAEGRIYIFLYPHTRTTLGLYQFLIVFTKFWQNQWRIQRIRRQTDVERSKEIQLPFCRGSEEGRRKSPYRDWSLKTGPQALLYFSRQFPQWLDWQPNLTLHWKDRTKQPNLGTECFMWLRSLLPSHGSVSAVHTQVHSVWMRQFACRKDGTFVILFCRRFLV